MNPMHHISPVPDGFLVRVARQKVITQFFIAKGTPKALRVAQRIRDKLLAGLPPVPYDGARPICHQVARSNTGYVGITYSVYRVRGHEYERLGASVRSARGVPRGRSFQLRTYGSYEEALVAAVEWREEILARRRATMKLTR